MNIEAEHHQYLSTRIVSRVAYVALRRPPVNSLSSAVIAELQKCFEGLAADGNVKAVVLYGEGKCFAAGADIKEFTAAFGDQQEGERMALAAQHLFRCIEELNKPVLCAIHGPCLGGGLELAMSCHLRVASNEAQLGLPELKLGLIPGYGGTQRLARLTNQAKALELILTSRFVDGQEAERIGLVNRSVPSGQLMDTVTEWAETIANEKSAVAVSAAIQAVREGGKTTLSEGLQLEASLFGALFTSEDAKEGVTAFLEKRIANFKDR
jgi:enoyl-CoA hydratase